MVRAAGVPIYTRGRSPPATPPFPPTLCTPAHQEIHPAMRGRSLPAPPPSSEQVPHFVQSMRALPKRGPARARRADPGLSTLCRTVHTILRASDAVSTTSGRPTKMRTVALLEFKRVRAEIHRRGADATADLRSIFETIGQTRVRKSSAIDGLHEALERGEAHFRQRPGGAEPAAARGCTANAQDKLRLVGVHS